MQPISRCDLISGFGIVMCGDGCEGGEGGSGGVVRCGRCDVDCVAVSVWLLRLLSPCVSCPLRSPMDGCVCEDIDVMREGATVLCPRIGFTHTHGDVTGFTVFLYHTACMGRRNYGERTTVAWRCRTGMGLG